MKAFAVPAFDEPARLMEVPPPSCGPQEVLVRVEASSVNPVDGLVAAGFFRNLQEHRFPLVFGRDLAGVVEEVGSEVQRFVPGQRVWGFVKREYVGDGTFAELVSVSHDACIWETPAEVSQQDAGVLGLSGVTALQCIDAVGLTAGESVFINGATGGVGSYAIQMAVAQGASVIATGRPGAEEDHVRAMGAGEVVDWSEDVVEQTRRLRPEGVSALIDLVRHTPPVLLGEGEDHAHEEFARLCHGLLSSEGRAASTTNGGDPAILDDVPWFNVHSAASQALLERVADSVATGKVRAPIFQAFVFDEIESAFELLDSGRATGKISIVM